MFSWLNFEELLIHDPIELINPSKDTISVAMSQKQYIEFFSNKYTYNGLYYDEEMDFCLFYYADPLQSAKNGDVYAQGYIDVEMKIYRVKWLCNVSIRYPDGKKWNVKSTEMRVSTSSKSITMIQSGTLFKCTTARDITGWKNSKPNGNYNYRKPYYELDFGGTDFIISGYGLRGLQNG
nr:MAG TPA: Minor structural protein 4 [Caudoviricetes sp.]